MGDTLEGFPDFFKYAVWNLLNTCGGSVGSGSRSASEQQHLIDTKGLWSPSNPGAAPLGTSNHQAGAHSSGAADMEGDLDCMHAHAAQFGLHFPIGNEPWHIEPTDELIAQGMGYFGLPEGATGEEAQPGEPVAAEDPMAYAERLLFGGAGDDEGDISAEPNTPPKVPAATGEVTAELGSPTDPFVPQASAGFTAGGGQMAGADVAKVLAQAGFTGDALVKAVAISMGESGWDSTATGDTSLTNATWGPSMGLMQIRSVNAERGQGTWRDATRLHDPTFNARAAYSISNGGTDFSPWTVYTKGIWTQFTDEAKAAVAAIGGGVGMATPAPAVKELSEETKALDDLLTQHEDKAMEGTQGEDIVPGLSPASEMAKGMKKREEFARG
jgi:hypothetical protein